jgi:hypothetical protein
MKSFLCKFGSMSLVALAVALALSVSSCAQSSGRNIVAIRGRQQLVYYYPASGQKLNRKVLFAPGDGGSPTQPKNRNDSPSSKPATTGSTVIQESSFVSCARDCNGSIERRLRIADCRCID